MPKQVDEALYRTSLWLYFEDVLYLETTYGYGWTEQVREIVHETLRRRLRDQRDRQIDE